MKFLLDTHLLLWSSEGASRLPPSARVLLTAPDHRFFYSVASIWEVAIKSARNRSDFRMDAEILRRSLLEIGHEELPILGEHVLATRTLPAIHKAPFDRILLAQAISEGITLVTADAALGQYPGGSVLWVK